MGSRHTRRSLSLHNTISDKKQPTKGQGIQCEAADMGRRYAPRKYKTEAYGTNDISLVPSQNQSTVHDKTTQ